MEVDAYDGFGSRETARIKCTRGRESGSCLKMIQVDSQVTSGKSEMISGLELEKARGFVWVDDFGYVFQGFVVLGLKPHEVITWQRAKIVAAAGQDGSARM